MSSLFAEAWLSLFSKDHYDFMKDFATAGNKPRADILIVRNSIHSSLCNLSKSKLLAAEQSKIAVQLNNSLTSATTSSPSKRHLECLTELLMFYMNGQSLEWAYLPIVTLAQTAQRVADKRLAYLLCCLLHSSTKQAADLPLALLNTIRKDLKHANEWVVQAALGAAMELNNADIAPALITDLQHNLLSHSSPRVRKKALLLARSLVKHLQAGELAATLKRNIMQSNGGDNLHLCLLSVALMNSLPPDNHLNAEFVQPLLPELKQLTARILFTDSPAIKLNYHYHGLNAPWYLCDILQLFGRLLRVANTTTETAHLQTALDLCKLVIDAVQGGVDGAFFVLLSAVKLLAEAVQLLHKCTAVDAAQIKAIREEIIKLTGPLPSRFIIADNNNLCYIGLCLLQYMAAIDPMIVSRYQMEVVSCLEQSLDATLTEKALSLLFATAQPNNYRVIFEKSLEYVRRLDNACESEIIYIAKQLVEIVLRFANAQQNIAELLLVVLNEIVISRIESKRLGDAKEIIDRIIDSIDNAVDCETVLTSFAHKVVDKITHLTGRLFDFVLDVVLRHLRFTAETFQQFVADNAAAIEDEQKFLRFVEASLVTGIQNKWINDYKSDAIDQLLNLLLAGRSFSTFECRHIAKELAGLLSSGRLFVAELENISLAQLAVERAATLSSSAPNNGQVDAMVERIMSASFPTLMPAKELRFEAYNRPPPIQKIFFDHRHETEQQQSIGQVQVDTQSPAAVKELGREQEEDILTMAKAIPKRWGPGGYMRVEVEESPANHLVGSDAYHPITPNERLVDQQKQSLLPTVNKTNEDIDKRRELAEKLFGPPPS